MACGGGGGDQSGFEITKPGSGTPNALPLSPTYAGIRREYFSGLVTTAIGPTERYGKTVVRFQGGTDVRYFRESDVGVVYDGSTRIGRFPTAILLVPNTVRDGMQWQLFGSTRSLLGTYEAHDRGMQQTLFGMVRVWRVTQKNEVSGAQFYTDYAEGFGPIELDADPLVYAVTPNVARPAKQTPKRTALTPLGDGKPLSTELWADSVTVVAPQTGPASLRINGQIGFYENLTGSGIWRVGPAVACGQIEGGAVTSFMVHPFTVSGQDGSEAPCPDANGAVIGSDGTITRAAITYLGQPVEYGLSSLFLDGSGIVRGIGRMRDPRDMELVWYRGDPRAVDPNGRRFDQADFGFGGSFDWSWRLTAPLGEVLSSTVSGDLIPFVVRFGDRIVWSTSSEATGFAPLELVGTVPGAHVSSRLTPTERSHLLVSRDGVIDTLSITATGASVSRLVELDLPDTHELIGATPDGDGLIAFTLGDREEFAGPAVQPHFGALHAWRVTLPPPRTAADEGGPAPELDIAVFPGLRDLEICFARGDVSVTGWKLAHQPVAAFATRNNHCVLLLRDDPNADINAADAWFAEGDAPGVGAISIALTPALANTNTTFVPEYKRPIAAHADGGFSSRSLVYDEAGFAYGVPASPITLSESLKDQLAVDANGLGVWSLKHLQDSECGSVATPCDRLTRTGDRTLQKIVQQGGFDAPLAGGGVMYTNVWTAEQGTIAADGTLTILPPAPGSTNTIYRGGALNGPMCGIRTVGASPPYDLFCRDANGDFRFNTLADQFITPGLLYPGPGGFYYDASTDSETALLYFFDPATLTVRPVELEGFAQPTEPRTLQRAWSATGDLFILVSRQSDNVVQAILQITNGKAKAVSLPPSVSQGQLLVSPDLLIVGGQTRIPRP